MVTSTRCNLSIIIAACTRPSCAIKTGRKLVSGVKHRVFPPRLAVLDLTFDPYWSGAISQLGTHSPVPLIHCETHINATFEMCSKTVSALYRPEKQCNCGPNCSAEIPSAVISALTWINGAEFKPGTGSVWSAGVQFDSVGGTEPVI